MPGAAVAVHTFGDFQQFNPHLHLIATDGCFYAGGTFTKGPGPEAKDLEELFRYQVLEMLKAEGKINDAVIEKLKRNSPTIIHTRNCRPSTIGPNNNDDGFIFFVIQVSCCQKWAKPQLFASYAMSDRSLLVSLLSGFNCRLSRNSPQAISRYLTCHK